MHRHFPKQDWGTHEIHTIELPLTETTGDRPNILMVTLADAHLLLITGTVKQHLRFGCCFSFTTINIFYIRFYILNLCFCIDVVFFSFFPSCCQVRCFRKLVSFLSSCAESEGGFCTSGTTLSGATHCAEVYQNSEQKYLTPHRTPNHLTRFFSPHTGSHLRFEREREGHSTQKTFCVDFEPRDGQFGRFGNCSAHYLGCVRTLHGERSNTKVRSHHPARLNTRHYHPRVLCARSVAHSIPEAPKRTP